MNYYGCYGNHPKGLVFCSRKEEAKELATLFNQRGISSSYLSGDHSIEERESEILKLETGQISYIFTVDIFNEGIDIPKINQIVMLRNTESSIIFIQQLGRGLRKDTSKEFVTVIDFIGNYKSNYMIPMALSGDNSNNKSNLRRYTIDVSYISGLSAINFEQIAKEKIFSSIDRVKLDSLAELKKNYFALKNRLNRVPYLKDFYLQRSLDPLVIIGKEKSYYQFLKRIGEAEEIISEVMELALRFVSVELLSGVRAHELIILNYFFETQSTQLSFKEIQELLSTYNISCTTEEIRSAIRVLDLSFYESVQQKKYMPSQLFVGENDQIKITNNLKEFWQNNYFNKLMLDVIETGLLKSEQFDRNQPLTLYQKYRRKDALRVLNMVFNQNEQGIGGYTFSNHQFAIFVTLDKGKDFKASLMSYEDEFLDESTFRWFTKSPRTITSPEVEILKNPDSWTIHLFIKRKYNPKDNEIDFYYLGEMKPIQDTIEQKQKPTSDGKLKNVVEMDFKLKNPVESNMYEFLTEIIEK